MSVYGTGCFTLNDLSDFLAGMVTGAVQLSEDARYCRVSAEAYALQRAIPSARGRVTPRSHVIL